MYNVRTYDIRIYESVPHSYICYNAFDINQFCSIHGLIFNLFFFWYFIRILCVWLWTIWFDGRNVISDCHSRRSKTEQRDNFRFYFLFAGINCCECVAMHECQNVCTPQFQLLFLRHNFIFLYIFFYFVCVLFVCQFNESKRLEILFDHPFLISIYDRYNCGATSSISNLVSFRCYSTVALESNCCCCDHHASVLLQRLENKSIRRLLLWLLHQKRNSETHIGQNDGNARMRERERRVTKILSTNEQQKKPGWQRTHCKVQNLTKMLYRLFTRLFLFCISHYYATIYDWCCCAMGAHIVLHC